jgi:hypothetical protein
MQLKYTFVCEAANISNGALNALGIFDVIQAMSFPCVHPKFTYVSNIEFHRTETGVHKFKLSFVYEDGRDVIAPVSGEVNVVPNSLRTSLLMQFAGIEFKEEGVYELKLSVDDVPVSTETIRLVTVKQQLAQ